MATRPLASQSVAAASGRAGDVSPMTGLPRGGAAERFAVPSPRRGRLCWGALADGHRYCSRGASDAPHTGARATADVVEEEFCGGRGGGGARARRAGSCWRRGGGSAGEPAARLRRGAGGHGPTPGVCSAVLITSRAAAWSADARERATWWDVAWGTRDDAVGGSVNTCSTGAGGGDSGPAR